MRILYDYAPFDHADVTISAGQNIAAGVQVPGVVLLPSIRNGYTSAQFDSGTHTLTFVFRFDSAVTIDCMGVFGIKVVGETQTDSDGNKTIASLPTKPSGDCRLVHYTPSETAINLPADQALTWSLQRSIQRIQLSSGDQDTSVITWAAQKWMAFSPVTATRFDLHLRLNSYPDDYRFFVGRVIAGEYWEPNRNFSDGAKVIREDPLRISRSDGAYVETPRYAPYRTFVSAFQAVDRDFADRFEEAAFPGEASPVVVNILEDQPDRYTIYSKLQVSAEELLPGDRYNVRATFQEITRG